MSEWWEEEEPISEEEEAWGREYWDYLAVGGPYPTWVPFGSTPRRLGRIREVLDARWRAGVRRITHRRRT